MDCKKYAGNQIKMKTFNSKSKTCQHEKLNSLKGIIRNKELSLAILEEIKTALGTQGVINSTLEGVRRKYKRSHIFWYSINIILNEIKIGYYIKNIEYPPHS